MLYMKHALHCKSVIIYVFNAGFSPNRGKETTQTFLDLRANYFFT